MTLETIIAAYGYPAIWIGTFLEGETILVLGGLAAYQGYLKLIGVIFAAFAGSLMGDQLFFYLGRRHSHFLLKKQTAWRPKIARAEQFISRYESAAILSFRFLYGLRTIMPFVLGMGGVRTLKFVILNTIGALVWAAVIGSAGYLFGHAVETIIGEIKHFEKWLLISVLVVGLLVWVFHFRRRRNAVDQHPASEIEKKQIV